MMDAGVVEVIIVGSSSGHPSPDRACASWLLRVGEKLYQFDAGDGFSSSLLRQKIDHSAIGTIIISHTHPDHIAGLLTELQMMHLDHRRASLAIYLPEEAIEPLKGFMLATYLFPERLGFEVDTRPVRPDPAFRDENVAVYVRANSHLQGYQGLVDDGGYANRMQSYSYVIKTADRKIIYSGDVASLDDYCDLLGNCHLLITEGLHLDLEQLFQAVAENGVGALILTHLSRELCGEQDSMKALARKYGIENFLIAEDGLRFRL